MQSRAIKILVTAAVVLGGAGLLVYSSLAEAEYYKHVHEVLAKPGDWKGKNLRIHGFVQAGTIKESIEKQVTKRVFVLEYNGKRIKVRNEGPKPDTFRDLAEVVAKGTLVEEGGEYVFDATELSAKCPSKYEEGQRTKGKTGGHPANIPKGTN
jgi:cytochrome c-type biogenesis protein CcmE